METSIYIVCPGCGQVQRRFTTRPFPGLENGAPELVANCHACGGALPPPTPDVPPAP